MQIVAINKIKILIDNKATLQAEAIIMSASGEMIKKFSLHIGDNEIDISEYSDKNYSIKIIHGDNISVQKI